MNRERNFLRSPRGFNNNSRGCSPAFIGTEPVVMSCPHAPNPAGVEQLSDDKTGIVYSTLTGSAQILTSLNHGFGFTSPAAILITTLIGSVKGSNE